MMYLTMADAHGRIVQVHAAVVLDRTEHEAEGYTLVEEVSDSSTQYVCNGVVVDRPKFDLSIDGATLRGVPAQAAVAIEGVTYTADGTDITLSFTLHGSYNVLITLWPYLDRTVTIEN